MSHRQWIDNVGADARGELRKPRHFQKYETHVYYAASMADFPDDGVYGGSANRIGAGRKRAALVTSHVFGVNRMVIVANTCQQHIPKQPRLTGKTSIL